MNQFQSFAAFFLFISSLATLLGQEQELQPVQCRFVALDETPGELVNALEGKEVPVKIVKGRISSPIQCFASGGQLSFSAADTRKPLASVKVPKNLKKAVLLFVKTGKKGEGGWKIFPFENSAKSFPAGGGSVVNLHSEEIRFILGEEKSLLKPMQSKGFPLPEKRNKFNMAPVVFQFKSKSGEWANGKESSYRFLPTTRYLLVAYVDPRNKRPRVKTFKDTVRAAQPAK